MQVRCVTNANYEKHELFRSTSSETTHRIRCS